MPVALAPGDEFDKGGCFSGSAVDDDGKLVLIYTGHNYIDKEKDIFYENQNIAVSNDGGITFEKYINNPIIAKPPVDSIHHFRDPKVWKHKDKWYMVVGNSTNDNIGRVILYTSSDLYKWDYVGTLATSKGELGYMWESEMPTKQDGWCGALTIPRELTLSYDDKVMMNPVEELKTLREECILEEKNINVCENKNYALKTNESMMEVNIEFDLSEPEADDIGVNIKGIEDDELSLNYNKNISELILDCTKCGKNKDGVRKAILSKEEKLSLRIFIDRLSVEVFINKGEAAMTSRIYPKNKLDGIEIYSRGNGTKIKCIEV